MKFDDIIVELFKKNLKPLSFDVFSIIKQEKFEGFDNLRV